MPTQTLVTSASYDRINIGSNGRDATLAVDQFDPSLGTLQSATFIVELTSEVEGTLLGDPNGAATQSVSILATQTVNLDPQGERASGITGAYAVTAIDPSYYLSGFGPTSIAVSGTYVSPTFDINNVGALVGTGDFVFDIDSRERLIVNGTGPIEAQMDSLNVLSSAEVTVTYTFDTGDSGGVLSGGGNVDLVGDGGNNVLTGTDGADSLFGGAGHDILEGRAGSDVMQGGTGNDRYYIEQAGDTIVGEVGYADGGGIDTVYAFIDHTLDRNVEILRLQGTSDLNGGGNWAPESLVGNTGKNQLAGSGGDDRINGKAGDDQLIGGVGADTLVGDFGADTFVYEDVNESRVGQGSRDFINGFERGADRINLSGIDADSTIAGNQSFEFIGNTAFSGDAGELRWFSWGGNNYNIVEVDVDGDAQADMQVFVNLTATMQAADFVL